jgi:hypothetical protein
MKVAVCSVFLIGLILSLSVCFQEPLNLMFQNPCKFTLTTAWNCCTDSSVTSIALGGTAPWRFNAAQLLRFMQLTSDLTYKCGEIEETGITGQS